MASKNDITGDLIQTKISNDNTSYADNYERIFGKKEKKEVEVEPIKNNGPKLPAGLQAAWDRRDKK
tara:strand:- start:479 stop:676 length:198 start_codon:yes stop_codon:yes gene_type:complete